jgi:hypothetical protein
MTDWCVYFSCWELRFQKQIWPIRFEVGICDFILVLSETSLRKVIFIISSVDSFLFHSYYLSRPTIKLVLNLFQTIAAYLFKIVLPNSNVFFLHDWFTCFPLSLGAHHTTALIFCTSQWKIVVINLLQALAIFSHIELSESHFCWLVYGKINAVININILWWSVDSVMNSKTK